MIFGLRSAPAAKNLLVDWQIRNATATGRWRFLGGAVEGVEAGGQFGGGGLDRDDLEAAFPLREHELALWHAPHLHGHEVGLPAQVANRFGLAGMAGSHGIGHTRMATESAVTTDGAHPFSTGADQCLVHNGSLSNHRASVCVSCR